MEWQVSTDTTSELAYGGGNVTYYNQFREKCSEHLYWETDDNKRATVAIEAGRVLKCLHRLKIVTRFGEFEYPGKFVIPPAGVLVRSFGEQTGESKPIPSWAPEKLRGITFPEIGPYTIGCPSDKTGAGTGGEYISPHRFGWRTCPTGYQRAAEELDAVANRMPVFYEPGVEAELFSLADNYDRPPGYGFDLDEALDWDPHAMDYLQYKTFDGQHLIRAYLAAQFLKDRSDWARYYLRMMVRHVRMAWAPRDIPGSAIGNSCYWTTRQWLDQPDSQICRGLGREAAHVARLIWSEEPDSELAMDLEVMFHRAGIPWFLDDNPNYAKNARIPHGGIFTENEGLAQCREWMLAGEAVKLRPRLDRNREAMVRHHGHFPGWVQNRSGMQYGDSPADYELFYGDTTKYENGRYGRGEFRYSNPVLNVMVIGSRRAPDGGAQPMNCFPREFWEDHVQEYNSNSNIYR